MSKPADLVQGTLDMLLLKILALEPMNGFAVSQRLKQVSGDVLQMSDGSLYELQVANGMLTVLEEEREKDGSLKRVKVESARYVESDTALINRVIGRQVGGKQNILVLNDEAHHAYRIKRDEPDPEEEDEFDDEEEADEFFQEATVWIDGLDKLQKQRGINFCVDLSATPYFLGRVGQETNKPFPWVVTDFGLIDAIESGLVKIPQLAVRDTTGEEIPGYLNIWQWILEKKLTPAERGGKRGSPKPEAILKYAHHPIAMLGGLWEKETVDWAKNEADPRPPVFILVCKNTRIARAIYEWLAEDKAPTGIPPARVEGFLNKNGRVNTIRVDTKVIHETDVEGAKGDEVRWMRFTLDTVGKTNWPADRQGRPLYPEGFEELAKKLERPLHPPGRDVRCIVSVGMLTEGWDCNTVTHIIGLRPFMSQLLCEQVVGRGLRRVSYELGENGRFTEEVAKVFGVPFEVIPFKANPQGPAPPRVKKYHVHAIPEKAHFEIQFPRVEGYPQGIRNRIAVDWENVPRMVLQPDLIPPKVDMKGLSISDAGRLSLMGPNRVDEVTLQEYRARMRLQELVFDLARGLTKEYVSQPQCPVPAHVLFPQLVRIIQKYMAEKVEVRLPADLKDLGLAPYYPWLVEILTENIRPDTAGGEAPEIPRYESSRGPGSTAEVDFWTSREPREVVKSHLNYIVPDTQKWEQAAAYYIDSHAAVDAFVKNSGLGFAIPHLHNGQMHDYIPDFIIRLKTEPPVHLILETKGYDPLEEVKKAAAERWVDAVNADGTYGRWAYTLVKKTTDVSGTIKAAAEMNPQLVWYAAYGSNLCRERFLCYIQGGTPRDSKRTYVGCHDKSLPRDVRPTMIPHRLFFAGRASGWSDKAMAFIHSASNGESYGRMFLISFSQFDQLIQQEQGAEKPSEKQICPPLSYITANDSCFANTASPNVPVDPTKKLRYGRILNLGTEGDYPVLTFTALGPDNEIAEAAPSREYVQTIACGIRETFPKVTTEQICSYFLECDGVRGNISREELNRWLSE